ncbi:MAG TPA: squalene/phytoene synthase family protein [Stellaceae bacterium]|nr:squalene/phytoene synthase family protein [Stellaceae bacterium]
MPHETLSRKAGGLSPIGALVREHDRDRFQTALFAPAGDREALFALYAFNYEIARVRESVREPMLGQIRLQWWREAVETAFAGGEPRRHDIAEAIAEVIRRGRLSRDPFHRLIDTRERDFDADPPASLAALEDYAEGSAAPLVTLALEALGAATPAAREAGRHVGIAYALSGILRALPHLARVGRLMLPADLAAQAGLDPHDISRNLPALREVAAAIAAAAARHLGAARALRPQIPARGFPALLQARIAAQALRRLERARFDPLAPEIGRGDPLQPWRLAAASLLKRF